MVKLGYLLLTLLLAGCNTAQVAKIDICDLLADPTSFLGKQVSVRGIAAYEDEAFLMGSKKCKSDQSEIGLSIDYSGELFRKLQEMREKSDEKLIYGVNADIVGTILNRDNQYYVRVKSFRSYGKASIPVVNFNDIDKPTR